MQLSFTRMMTEGWMLSVESRQCWKRCTKSTITGCSTTTGRPWSKHSPRKIPVLIRNGLLLVHDENLSRGNVMAFTQEDCEKALAGMSSQTQAQFLAGLGHIYTVFARDSYEFQGPGVTNPRLLRDFNEVHHR